MKGKNKRLLKINKNSLFISGWNTVERRKYFKNEWNRRITKNFSEWNVLYINIFLEKCVESS